MLVNVLLALTVIMITARVMGAMFARFGQPAVIGEVVGGILLGPSLLGRVAPSIAATLVPPDAAPMLAVIAQIGVILYMFLVGLELDLDVMRARARRTLLISQASIATPFLLGGVLAWAMFDTVAPPAIPFWSFVLFIGVAMSVTAFPVLARILSDRGMQRTPLGTLALTCAAINDAIAWCLLAFVVGVLQDTPLAAVRTVALTFIYIAIMLTAGRAIVVPLARRLEASSHLGEQSLAFVLGAVLLSAVATEFIGIHAIFGAFLIGTIIPHDGRVARVSRDKIEDVVRVLFLPAFFAFTGLRTEIGLVHTVEDWLLCGLIIVVATAGKLGGTAVAAKLSGLNWRDSTAMGALMNTRGLVELIVLNIGVDLGVLTPRLFTMLVIMALVTTMMTSPLLSLVMNPRAEPSC